MVSIFAPLQTFFSMDINPERPIQQNTTFLDKSSSATFRNLHNKNSREKIKFNPLYKSGARATNLRLPQIFSFLTWLQHYVLEREIISNYDEDQQKQFENEQKLVEDTIDIGSFCCQLKRIGIFCSEFYEENELFGLVRKNAFVCILPKFMHQEIDMCNKN